MAADLYFQGQQRPAGVWSERARRAAVGLVGSQLGNGSRIGLFLPNGFDFIEANVAIGLAGSIAVPISTYLTDEECRRLAIREAFDAIVATSELLGRLCGSGLARCLIVDGAAVGPTSWDQLIANSPPNVSPKSEAPEQRFFTSGSTRLPKSVVRERLPAEVADLRTERFARAWGMIPGMRTVITGPLYHQAPLYYAMGALQCAERIVLLDDFDALTVLSAISEHGVTHVHMVPRLMSRLAALKGDVRAQYDLSTLSFVLHGAAACPPEAKTALIKWLGPIFREYYAASEFGIVSQCDSDEWLERPTSVGRAFEGVEIDVRDIKSGESLPRSELGRIFIKSDDMPSFHYEEGDGVSVVKTRNEWLTVDDSGYLDEDGYLHLTGRTDDIANISGMKVSAKVAQSALLELGYVDEAVVDVVSEPEVGDAFRAFICLNPGDANVSANQICNDLRKVLKSIEIPKFVVFVDELPITDTGKVITRYLDLNGSRTETLEGGMVGGIAERIAPAPTFPSNVEVVSKDLTRSTNDDAIALAPTSKGPFTLVWAKQQSAGRGRTTRSWISPPGNVYWTMLVDTAADPEHSTGLVFVTALAVHSTVRALTPGNHRVETKWPNDTLIDERKVSGALIESANGPNGQMRAVGVGINVTSFPTLGMIYRATCLRAEGSAAHRNDVLILLTSSFLSYLELWRSVGFELVRQEYLKNAYRFGETISVRVGKDHFATGIFHDISEAGIVLSLSDGRLQTIGAGDLLIGGN
jgi:long-chain acyl-CoA synthetase